MKTRQTESEYAKFHKALKGYDFLRPTGSPVYRWELYAMGYRNTTELIHNATKYEVVKRPEPVFEKEQDA